MMYAVQILNRNFINETQRMNTKQHLILSNLTTTFMYLNTI